MSYYLRWGWIGGLEGLLERGENYEDGEVDVGEEENRNVIRYARKAGC